jgi:hypothetical protein
MTALALSSALTWYGDHCSRHTTQAPKWDLRDSGLSCPWWTSAIAVTAGDTRPVRQPVTQYVDSRQRTPARVELHAKLTAAPATRAGEPSGRCAHDVLLGRMPTSRGVGGSGWCGVMPRQRVKQAAAEERSAPWHDAEIAIRAGVVAGFSWRACRHDSTPGAPAHERHGLAWSPRSAPRQHHPCRGGWHPWRDGPGCR